MTSKNCLNCGIELSGNYCSHCGQKTDTHRITFKHFISHDLLHGTFHIEKGMLFTAKEAMTRPGKAALDYISGKRVNYYNVFYFILILIGLNILLTHYYNEIALKIDPSRTLSPSMNEAGKSIGELLSKYAKFFIFALVPINALNSFLIFKRQKLNFSEHIIISGILLLGILIISLFIISLSFIEFLGVSPIIFDVLHESFPFLVLFYVIYGYHNAFKAIYSLSSFSLRMLLFLILAFIELLVFFFIIVGFAIDWKNGTEIEFLF